MGKTGASAGRSGFIRDGVSEAAQIQQGGDVEQRKEAKASRQPLGRELKASRWPPRRGTASGQAGWGCSPATPNTHVLLVLHPQEGHRGLCSPPSHKNQASPTLTPACTVPGWKEGHSAPQLKSPGFKGCEGGPWTCSGQPEAFAGLPGWPPAASRPVLTESLAPSSPSPRGALQSPLQAAEGH